MSAAERSENIEPHHSMEEIVIAKKATLLQRVGLPRRIFNLLGQRRDRRCSAEIIAFLAFPYSESETRLNRKDSHNRQLLKGGLSDDRQLHPEHFHEVKDAVQHQLHLTEHTRMRILDLLDECHKGHR